MNLLKRKRHPNNPQYDSDDDIILEDFKSMATTGKSAKRAVQDEDNVVKGPLLSRWSSAITSRISSIQRSISTTSLNTFLISYIVPREFRLPASLENAFDQSTLKSEIIVRLLLFTGIGLAFATDDVLDLLDSDSPITAWKIIFLSLDVVSVFMVWLLSFCFRKNPLWQKGVTFALILGRIFISMPYASYEGTIRIFLTVLCCFLSFQMSALACIVILLIMEWSVVLIPVLASVNRYVILQQWLIGLTLSHVCLQTVFQIQKETRRSFLSRHFMLLKQKEMELESEQMDFLLRQMLPPQIIEELRNDMLRISEGTSGGSSPAPTPHALKPNRFIYPATAAAGHAKSGRIVDALRDLSIHDAPTATTPTPSMVVEYGPSLNSSPEKESLLYRTFKSASVTFVKIRDFNHVTRNMTALEIIKMLSEVFSHFDDVVESHGLYRIKTIGESYMFAAGVPQEDEKHLQKNFSACLTILNMTALMNKSFREKIQVSCGMASGELMCGVIPFPSSSRVQYDAYGVTTIASRFSNCPVPVGSRSCIHISAENAAELDLSEYETSGPHKTPIKGRDTMDVLRIFGKKKQTPFGDPDASSVSSTPTAIPKKNTTWKHNRIMTHLSNMVKKGDQKTEFKQMQIKDVEHYIRKNSGLYPLDEMAATLPKSWVHMPEKRLLRKIIPGLLCFSNSRFNMLYLKHRYKKATTSTRLLFLTCLAIFLLGTISNVCTMYLYPERDSLDSMTRVYFQASEERFAKLTWSRIMLVRFGMGFPLLLLTTGWIYTPLFGLHWITYNFFSVLACAGLLLAQILVTVFLGATHFDQYIHIMFMIMISNVHGCYHLFKVLVLVFGLLVYLAIFVVSKPFWEHLEQALYNLMLVVFIFVICIHFQYLFRRRCMEAFLYSALSVKTLKQLKKRKMHTDTLLNSLLPKKLIVRAVKRIGKKNQIVGDFLESMSILNADIVGFTEWSSKLSPQQLFGHLNVLFSTFDLLAEEFQVYRVQLVGDMYSCCSGVITPLKNHQRKIVQFAFEILKFIQEYGHVEFRIGVHCGSGVSGVLNTSRLQWDIFGKTKSVAEVMEQTGYPGKIHISTPMFRALSEHPDEFEFEQRPHLISSTLLDNPMQTYFVFSRKAPIESEVEDVVLDCSEDESQTTQGITLQVPGGSSISSFHMLSSSSLFSSNPDESIFSIKNEDEDEIEEYLSVKTIGRTRR